MAQADSAYITPEELRARPALRAKIERAVDRLIALLDEIEGDTDREPEHDAEPDDDGEPDSDGEPWLGWLYDGRLAGSDDLEPNGDEIDCSFCEDDYGTAPGTTGYIPNVGDGLLPAPTGPSANEAITVKGPDGHPYILREVRHV